ncbi:MAG: prepilin-type N-terminal cleavage/methylation domain-containing protein [Nitrospira sp.]|nr:prepilin-type N-terminal cleavage/methylation domain-containing protein [bacterium]MBL7049907.1 prepilin-type N-terminal cleavage/methylation domain-containing protein [Nitrospira sp.]
MDRGQGSGVRKQRKDGFTLIEVMIALVVLVVGMLGVMGMQYYAVVGNTSSRDMRTATNLTQQLMEQMRSTAYTALTTGNDAPAAGTAISGGVNFTRRWWVSADCVAMTLTNDDNTCGNLAAVCNSDPDGALAVQSSAIRARTCWTDKNGVPHSVTMDTLRWNENVVP